MTDLPYLPVEIVTMIIGYVDDIDIRRYFSVYGKIDKDRFKILNKIMRKEIKTDSEWMNSTMYSVPNIYNFEERTKQKLPNDHINVNIFMKNGQLNYNISINKLVLKKGWEIDEIQNNVCLTNKYKFSICPTLLLNPPPYLFGRLGNFRWRVISSSYVI